MVGKGIKYSTYERATSLTIKRFEKILSATNDLGKLPPPLTAVQLRTLSAYLNELKTKKADFESNVRRVFEHLSEEEVDINVVTNHDDQIQSMFIEASTLIETLLPPTEPSSPVSTVGSIHPVQSQMAVKLPKLDLIKFDGAPLQWVSFINLFDTTIHRNSSICSVTKFQYLLSVLSGEPLSMVRGLNITPQNYMTAYQMLRDRYHSPRRLTTLHLNNLMDLPNASAFNTKGLRLFINSFYEHSQALKALDCDVTESNPLLSALLLRKLDQELRKRLENYRSVNTSDDETAASPHTLPSIDEIIKFLNTECNQVEDASLHHVSTSYNSKQKSPASKGKPYPSRDVSLVATNTSPKPHTASTSCFVCHSKEHKVYSCPNFKAYTPKERYDTVKKHNRCTSCLGNHEVRNCQSRDKCFTCQKSHHTLLHFQPKPSHVTEVPSNLAPTEQVQIVSAQGQTSPLGPAACTVVLGTALVKLTGENGHSHVFRALLDSGSMGDFISERAAQLLGSPRQKSDVIVSGLSGTSAQTRGLQLLDLESLSGDTLSSQHPFHILSKISLDLPRAQLATSVVERTRSYVLADPTYHLPSSVDVLLGNKICPALFTAEVYSLGHDMPFVVGTRLGFVVMGQSPCLSPAPVVTTSVVLHSVSDVALHDQIQKFWQQEQVPEFSRKSEEERFCDEHFENTHSRSTSGRYCIRLPFKPNRPTLGQSKQVAERRFLALENKFKTQPQFKQLYVEFMRDYESSGHMAKIDQIDLTSEHYFLPHHGVLKQNGNVAKLRTVFDASSKTSSSVSLNDVLLTGKKLQLNICDVLIQFRIHDFVFSCDVRQMFRQIQVNQEDQKYQLILWRENPDQPLNVYKLTTVTYGMNSSPYLALKTLAQLAEDDGHGFPEAGEVLKTNTYVDDCITGASTEDQALKLQQQLIALLRRGGFELRKWSSNSKRILESLPKDHLESPVFLQAAEQPHYSILGLHWSPTSDSFSYHFSLSSNSVTKRLILSTIAKVYDPCGFLSPITMWCKALMQILWTQGLSWDEPVDRDLAIKWQSFVSELKYLDTIQIPRAFKMSQASTIDLCGFSDASEVGYAAVVYLRCQMTDGTVVVRQVISKTRVAPLKRMTLPRLELCGAHLLAQLVAYCLSILEKSKFSGYYLWCDSTIALTWLKTPPYRLKTFIANRVAQAQEWVPTHWWHYVSGDMNPADCASRGISPSDLARHPLWWSGPEWLQLSMAQWPHLDFSPVDIASSDETKPIPLSVLTNTSQPTWDLLTSYSSWTRLQYVMGYILRFVDNCRHHDKRHGNLSAPELRSAELKIFKIVQHEVFSEDIASLNKNSTCSTQLRRLTPYLDSLDLLRVGGRLQKTTLPADVCHPIILPKKHPVVNILIDYYHRKNLHAGTQLTQAILRQRVWILSARSIIRSRIFKCMICFRHKPKSQIPLMGNLPSARVIPARPFLNVGVDYGGFFNIKIHNLRTLRLTKMYICVFVCLATKAVHIEVVTDLTTSAYIAALTRFISRRGICASISSDCATNFVGANNLLKPIAESLNKSEIQSFAAQKGILFKFNPPAAPHQGGLWESAIKSIKHHLKRVVGEHVLTLPEFTTLTAQIEAILNSRPLTPLSEDPKDPSALTPAHFLIGCPLTAVPEEDLLKVPSNRLKHWQLVQSLHQQIWKRWQLEYLNTLQQRIKWNTASTNLKIGDLVLVHQPTPPLTWPLARVEAVSPGSDNIVRVVHLKTSLGHLTRPVHKVFPLPCNVD